MKILWVCNCSLPIISEKTDTAQTIGGGWMTGIMGELEKTNEYNIVVCFPHTNISLHGEVNNITYYSFEQDNPTKYNVKNEHRFLNIIKEEKPDVIHIWGTEFPHTLEAVNACEQLNMLDRCIVHIQGLVSVYSKHFFADLPSSIIRAYTLRDIIKRRNIAGQQKSFEKRGQFEIACLKKIKHVMGRTEWDKACVKMINPSIRYHFCNESLRDEFYDSEWQLEKCEKHSIFVSQCSYPIKAFHKMLEAMEQIVRRHPDAHLYTTGPDLTKKSSFLNSQRQSYYSLYLRKLLVKYNLLNNVTFLGALDAKQMRDRYLLCNVFASPSSIENSPNSLGEAMLLGVPCVSSDVGGVSQLMLHGNEGFVYPFNESYMLAHYICKIFDDGALAQEISKKAKAHAKVTHDRKDNVLALINIYKSLLEG